MMKRVRSNVELLVERWRQHGFKLHKPLAVKPSQVDIELPLTLRAFYEVVGWIDFVERPPPKTEWPDAEELDALQVFALISAEKTRRAPRAGHDPWRSGMRPRLPASARRRRARRANTQRR